MKFNFEKNNPISAAEKIEKSWDEEKLKIVEKQLSSPFFVHVKDKNNHPLIVEAWYLDAGFSSSDNTIAIIPGWTTAGDNFRSLAKTLALSGERRVVLFSLPGVGHSDSPPPEWLKENNFDLEKDLAQKTIAAVREQVGDMGKLTLIGHSLGGLLAAQMARDYRDEVEDLVLLNTAGFKKEPWQNLVARFILGCGEEAWSKIKDAIRNLSDEKYQTALTDDIFLSKKMLKNLLSSSGIRLHLLKYIDVLSRGGIGDIVKDVEANVVNISGDKERVFSSSEMDEILAEAIKARNKEGSVMTSGRHLSSLLEQGVLYGVNIIGLLDKVKNQK